MSDFTSDFWHYYVAGLTLVSILACLVVLWIGGSIKVKAGDDNTTGHVWDEDLREQNNPLPKWWVYLFIITVIFGLIYGLLYPMFGSKPGLLGWTSAGQYQAEKQVNIDAAAPLFASFSKMEVEQLARDPAAMAIGSRLYMNFCAQCHAADAKGSITFPNLTDKDWQWGADPEAISLAIAQGRMGVMPPMAEAVGTPNDVLNLAHYVLSLSNSPHDAVRAAEGRGNWASCAACHGSDGTGNTALGAPNLTDNYWLHGWGVDAVVKSINEGIVNVMPGQSHLLNEQQIHVLTAYVWSLSNTPAN